MDSDDKDTKFHPAEHEVHAPTRHTLPPRAYHQPSAHHASPTSAAALSLNGEWKFRFSPTLESAGGEDFAAPKFDDGKWGTLGVPSTWVLHGHGRPWYTNIKFPFPLDPPRVPDDNPTGDYRVVFDTEKAKWPKGGKVSARGWVAGGGKRGWRGEDGGEGDRSEGRPRWASRRDCALEP